MHHSKAESDKGTCQDQAKDSEVQHPGAYQGRGYYMLVLEYLEAHDLLCGAEQDLSVGVAVGKTQFHYFIKY